jgi:hypothetical protein
VTSLLGRLDAAAGTLLARLGRSRSSDTSGIALVAAVFLIPGQSALPLTDRDEARYVIASKQMLATGDFIEPRNLDEPRWKKPVGIYWLQSAAAALSGQGAEAPLWVYRLPSALGILAAALLTSGPCVRSSARVPRPSPGLSSPRASSPRLKATSPRPMRRFSPSSSLRRARSSGRSTVPEMGFGWPHALFWVALAGGVLIKGPIILIVAGGTLLWLTVSELSIDPLRRTKPWPGLALFALADAAVVRRHRLRHRLGLLRRIRRPRLPGQGRRRGRGHTGPPGYYLMTVWVTFWPWTPLALLALPARWVAAADRGRAVPRGMDHPDLGRLRVATTKLPHYVMPVLPAVGAVIGLWLVSGPRGPVLRWIAAALSMAGAIVLAGAAIAAPLWFEGASSCLPWPWPLLGLSRRAGPRCRSVSACRGAGVLGVVAGALLLPAILREALPRLDSLFLSPRMAALDARFDACAPFPLVTTGYRELSLAFYAGSTRASSAARRPRRLLRDPAPGARVFLPLAEGERLAAANGGAIHLLGTVEGINYNAGARSDRHGPLRADDDPYSRPAGSTDAATPRGYLRVQPHHLGPASCSPPRIRLHSNPVKVAGDAPCATTIGHGDQRTWRDSYSSPAVSCRRSGRASPRPPSARSCRRAASRSGCASSTPI